MTMLAEVFTIDRTSPEFPNPLDMQSPVARTMKSPLDLRSNAGSLKMPCVPLTDQQMQDYQALMSEVNALMALGRQSEARRVTKVASTILRTGAPALE